jgi:betaine reductase
MDLESQGRIRQVVDQAGAEGVVAILGAGSPAAVEMMATTLMTGDPSWAGPLAGVELRIPSFHILEPDVVGQVSPDLYERELALPAAVFGDTSQLVARLKEIRAVGAS